MRLFAALDLDAPARAAIAKVQAALRAAIGIELRWVQPPQLHITLVFLGDVSESQAGAVVTSIARPIPLPAFELNLAGLGAFPPRGAPRSLWIGIREGEPAVLTLHREILSRLPDARVDAGAGAFRPHLTIARFKRSRPRDRQVIAQPQVLDRAIRQEIDHVTLYQSELSSGPPRYVELARANLTSI
jgi:2'-5' RNA ligase